MTLPELVAFMRENNILHLKHEGTEITLMPELEAPPKPAEPDTRKGRLGMTKQEEMDLFNQVFPEDFAAS